MKMSIEGAKVFLSSKKITHGEKFAKLFKQNEKADIFAEWLMECVNESKYTVESIKDILSNFKK